MAWWRRRNDGPAGNGLGNVLIGDVSGQVVIGDYNIVVSRLNTTVVTQFNGPDPEITRLPGRPLELGPEQEPVGRARFTTDVLSLLGERIPVQVHGPAGAGKSALLRHVARQAEPDHPAVVYLNARHSSFDDLCQDLFESCHDAGMYRPPEAKRRRLLSAVEALVVVDHSLLPAADLDRLLDYAPRCVFLLGSRERTLWGRGRALELPPLEDSDGRELIIRELGRAPHAAEASTIVTALRESDGMPDKLLRCGAYLREISVKGAGAAKGDGLDADAQTALLLSWLSEPARQVLAVLARLPDTAVTADILPSLVGIDIGAAVLTELQRSRLTVVDQGRHRITPDVARVVPREVGDRLTPPDVTAATQRLTDWITEKNSAMAVAGEADLLVRILELAIEHQAYAAARALARKAGLWLAMSRRLDAWARVLFLGLRAAHSARSSDDEMYFLREIGTNQACRGSGVATVAVLGATALLGRRLVDDAIRETSRGKTAVKGGTLKGSAGIRLGAGAAGLAVAVGGVVITHGNSAKSRHPAKTPAPLAVNLVSFTESRSSPPYYINGSYAQVSGLKDPAVQEHVNQSLRAVVDDKITLFRKAAISAPPGSKIPQSFSDPARILMKGPRIVSVMYTFDMFTMGAHSMVIATALGIDLATGRLLTARDIFRRAVFEPEGRRRLAERVVQAADKRCVQRPQDVAAALAPANDPELLKAEGTALAGAVIAVTPTGVDLYFQPYTIADGACGVPMAHLPYAQIADLLQPTMMSAVSAGKTPNPVRS
jgi:hypothetical protein